MIEGFWTHNPHGCHGAAQVGSRCLEWSTIPMRMSSSWQQRVKERLWLLWNQFSTVLPFWLVVETCVIFPFGVSIVMGVPQNCWFIRENPIKLDDLGDPHLWKPPYVGNFKKSLLTTDELIYFSPGLFSAPTSLLF